MAKKGFINSAGFNTILGSTSDEEKIVPIKDRQKRGAGRPAKNKNRERTTYLVDADLKAKIKRIAFEEGYRRSKEGNKIIDLSSQDIVGEALEEYVKKYESKHGKIQLF